MTAASRAEAQNVGGTHFKKLLLCLGVGAAIWFLPAPLGVDPKGWKVFAVFIYVLLGMILKPMDAGIITLSGVMILAMTGVLTFEAAFSGFSNSTVWLIVLAFFIARGFIKTGLGFRIAYKLMSLIGKNTLGMTYGIICTDWILSSAIPSITARAGGIIYPIVSSLSQTFESYPGESRKKIGAYLMQTIFQCGAVTSAMFLTAMSGNPMIQNFALSAGVHITWTSWAIAAALPGFISLLIIPYLLYKLYPPEVKRTPEARAFALKKLKERGPMSYHEWIMIGAFIMMIFLWISGSSIHVHPTLTALLGLTLLIVTGVISWEEVLAEKSAWNTLIWFACLCSIASAFSEYGLMEAFSTGIGKYVGGLSWQVGFAVIAILYFYAHYFFASNIAHITTMYTPFLLLSIVVGTPPVLAALVLGFFSSLFGALTTYGSGPAPIYFGSGYVTTKEWWTIGFWIGLVNVVIWVVVGSIWWHALGLF